MSKKKIITLNTDASFCPKNKIWGYAYWIKSDNFFYKWGWAFKEYVWNSTEAEIKAIAIWLWILETQLHDFDYLIINRDNIHANKKSLRKYVCKMKKSLKEKYWSKSRYVQFKYVKAHTKITDSRTFVNDWCDNVAKNYMRTDRSKKWWNLIKSNNKYMKKHIKLEIDKLFKEMVEKVKEVWLSKKCSHRWRGWVMKEYSDTIMSFRTRTLTMIRDINFLNSQEERNEFMRWFWRKTTPYLWGKKELDLS